jgi:hypothetical protein
MMLVPALGVGPFAGGALVFARWRGEVAVRRELAAAADRAQPKERPRVLARSSAAEARSN